MPNWADDEGRFWWQKPGNSWWQSVEIPHPPVTTEAGCTCACCEYYKGEQPVVEIVQPSEERTATHEHKIYTGIGSRETPPEVLAVMEKMGYQLARYGWTLRSGHAPGADQAFEFGARQALGKMEIYLPWDGFEGTVHDGMEYFTPSNLYCSASTASEARVVAAKFHPAWNNCREGARKLHTRNVFQVSGHQLDLASTMVICWTERGKRGGGTGQALRVAEYLKIPIFDLAVCTSNQVLNFINYGVLP